MYVKYLIGVLFAFCLLFAVWIPSQSDFIAIVIFGSGKYCLFFIALFLQKRGLSTLLLTSCLGD
jgi:hypothetical protein